MNYIELKKIRNIDEYKAYTNFIGNKRNLVENLISADNIHKEKWEVIGYCQCCNKESRFLLDWKASEGKILNFRERLVCEHCALNTRQRFMAKYLMKVIENFKDEGTIYCYEYVTNFYQFLEKNLKDTNITLTGSEYFGYDKKPGEIINNIPHEDALNLSFQNESIDIIISNDVYEHVPDINKAIQEAYRVLKPKGKLVFTVPFYSQQNEIKQRAIMEDGKIINFMREQYHGNPISEKGSLVFNDFGWNLLELFRKIGFKDVYAIAYYSFFYGYLGNIPMMFVAEK